MWDLSPPTRDKTCVPQIGRQILNHWTTREIPTWDSIWHQIFLGNLESENLVWRELFPVTASFHLLRASPCESLSNLLSLSRTGPQGRQPGIRTSQSSHPQLLRLPLASWALPEPSQGRRSRGQDLGPDIWVAAGFPGGTSGKEPACQCRRHRRCRFDIWVRKIPWRRQWPLTLVFFPGESRGQRSLTGYSP